MHKLEIKLNKAIYVSMCILDIFKICLHEFHHDCMSPMYSEKYKVIYTDMDTLIYHMSNVTICTKS